MKNFWFTPLSNRAVSVVFIVLFLLVIAILAVRYSRCKKHKCKIAEGVVDKSECSTKCSFLGNNVWHNLPQ